MIGWSFKFPRNILTTQAFTYFFIEILIKEVRQQNLTILLKAGSDLFLHFRIEIHRIHMS